VRYMLMMISTKAGFEGYRAWSREDVDTHFAHLRRINKNLSDSGEFVETHGLAWPGEAKVVRAARDGAPITDGIFPESKEFLAGYWMVEVATPQRAYEIAAQIIGRSGARRRAAEHADRGAAGYERAVERWSITRLQLPVAEPGAAPPEFL